ncbi:hypothetical protein CLUG_04151 [Clavispora lusitaniae ATCC 42720]|uniref:Uncharacterized protein n=1 Tax=Clavispora lusitaniae (strain ATCC 42720) TaxID=306902 RepID=C4Y7H3_CLAL4|nr:uncharacterized protein CLUG_04151 [Clavispora lusitaniae ATCC 42720]EEQ40024.1 hypothetical protein CLUG_04151 [Clavispora lusitaniae ATCC 42720]
MRLLALLGSRPVQLDRAHSSRRINREPKAPRARRPTHVLIVQLVHWHVPIDKTAHFIRRHAAASRPQHLFSLVPPPVHVFEVSVQIHKAVKVGPDALVVAQARVERLDVPPSVQAHNAGGARPLRLEVAGPHAPEPAEPPFHHHHIYRRHQDPRDPIAHAAMCPFVVSGHAGVFAARHSGKHLFHERQVVRSGQPAASEQQVVFVARAPRHFLSLLIGPVKIVEQKRHGLKAFSAELLHKMGGQVQLARALRAADAHEKRPFGRDRENPVDKAARNIHAHERSAVGCGAIQAGGGASTKLARKCIGASGLV